MLWIETIGYGVDVLKQPAQSQDKGKGEIQPPSLRTSKW